MKKRILLMTLMLALFVCAFAVSVNAANDLKPQTSDAYGELSFFDESVTVGRTNTKYGFTPFMADGETYARVVVGDGTTFYTFPTAYVLSNTDLYGVGEKSIYYLKLASLNSAMESVTGTNPNWTKDNVYRIELPKNTTYLNGGDTQSFKQYANLKELYLQPNSTTKDEDKQMLLFWNCKNLEVIHNLDTFVFRNKTTGGAFQNCAKLTNIKIGVSPEVTTTQDSMFAGCTALVSVNFAEAFPNLTEIGKYAFSGCTNLKTVYSATLKQEGAVFVQEGVTWIGQEAFYNCDSIKYLSLPSTITYLGPSIIRDSSGLEFVDFNENANAINLDNWGHFKNCTSLKAVSLPDGIQTISNRFMSGEDKTHMNVQAVYLPASLKQMNTNGNGQGPFCFSSKLYFVQEPFEVRDENGLFYGNSFVMPSKPDTYYMPSNLATAGGNASSGTWFRDCASLNNVIVMPAAFTQSTVAQMFRGIASSSQRKAVVYLGKITDICWSEMNKYIDFVFANSGNTDISTINFTSFYNRNNENCYFYFCSTGYRYTMAASDATAVAATKVENSYHHICDIKNSNITPATCIKNAYGTLKCFCSFNMGTQEIANSATGVHIYADDHDCTTSDKCTSDPECTAATEALSHDILETLVYVSFTSKGTYNYLCQNDGCTVVDIVDEEKNAIVSPKGYSLSDAGTGINGGYNVDVKALKLYEEVNGKITFGIAIANPERFESGASFFDADNKLNTAKGIQIEMSSRQYGAFDCSINGFAPEHADTLKLVITSYIIDENGEVFFFQHENNYDIEVEIGEQIFNYVTLNIAKNKTPVTNTLDAVLPTNED